MSRLDDQSYLKTLTVMYVEDNEDVRGLFTRLLERRCGKVLACGDGAAGLEAYRAHAPHIVVTDILMPVMDGLGMARALRALNPNVPIIVTTAFEQHEYLLRAIDLGIDKFVVKPVQTEQLFESLLACGRRLQAEEELRLAGQVFAGSHEAIVVTDRDNLIVKVNEAFCRLSGYAADELLGVHPARLRCASLTVGHYRAIRRSLRINGSWRGELRGKRGNGEAYSAELTITGMGAAGSRPDHHVATLTDISARKALDELHKHQALHDTLTDLPNRTLLGARLELAGANARRNGDRLALLYLDLDKFKAINDSLGHHAGDQVLREVADRLKKLFRANDTVCRLGGDEFMIVLTAVDERTAVLPAVEKIFAALSRPFVLDGQPLTVTSSVGVAIFPDDDTDLEALTRKADAAMYLAKKQGRNQFSFVPAP